MKVVIPMAGFGKRLRPHTYSRPKPLINVAGQPMVKHLIDNLSELDIDEYIFIVGYLGEQIEEYITQTYSFKARFVEQKELIGQAHAIYLAKEYLNGPAIILFSDTLFDGDLSTLKQPEVDGMVFTKEVEDPRRFGVVVLNDQGHITDFVEKPSTTENKQALIGLYYVREANLLIKAIETQMERKQLKGGEFYIADALQIMIEEGAIFHSQRVDTWLDTGKPETVLQTNRHLLENGFDNSSDLNFGKAIIIPPVYVHPDAVIEQSVIGPHATVSAGCEVRHSIITDSIVDVGATVKNSILSQSLIGRDAVVIGRPRKLNVGDTSSIDFT
ncbi:MAG: NTP transferase domain-containing protein [Chloroflexi bacterium]|nr:NTP transferase domain-containing protein [Chloroflexota bacterium]